MTHFCHFYSLFVDSSDIFGQFILVQMVCTVIVLSGAVYQCDLVMRIQSTFQIIFNSVTKIKIFNFQFQLFQHIRFEVTFVLMLIFLNMLNLFLYCFFGRMATESFEQMAICLYQANWPVLPNHLQKYFLLMIANAQRPLYYHGFGMVAMNLQTFTKVLMIQLTV